MKDELHLAKIQHSTEVLDDARHFCDLLTTFFKLRCHAIAFTYVPTHLQEHSRWESSVTRAFLTKT